MKNKIIAASVGFCVLVMAAVLAPRCVGIVLEWRVRSFCEKELGQSFAYSSFSREGQVLLFHDVRLGGREPAEGTPWDLTVRDLRLSYDYSFWSRRLKLDLDLDKVRLHLVANKQGTVRLPTLPEFGKSWIHVDSFMHLRAGRLEVTEESGVRVLEQFSFVAEGRQNGQGDLDLDLHVGSTQDFELQLKVAWDSERKQTGVQLAAHDVPLNQFHTLLGTVVPQWKNWRLSHGFINGDLDVEFSNRGLVSKSDGKLEISQLLFDHPPSGLSGGMTRGSLAFKKTPQLLLEQQSSADWKLGTFTIHESGSLVFYREGSPYASLHDIKGAIGIESRGQADLAIKGMLQQGGKLRGLEASGLLQLFGDQKGIFDGQLVLDSKSTSPFRLRGSLKDVGDQDWTVEGEVCHLGAVEWEILQWLGGFAYPKIQGWSLSHGDVSTRFEITGGALGARWLALNDCTSQDLGLHSHDLGLDFGGKSFRGQLSCGLGEAASMGGLSGQISFSDGSLLWRRRDDTPLVINDLDATLALSEGALEKAELTAVCGGLRTDLWLDWGQTQEIMRVRLSGEATSLPQLLPKERRPAFRKSLNGQQISLRASAVKKDLALAQVAGVLQIGSKGAAEGDSLHFGFDCIKGVGSAALFGQARPWNFYQQLVAPFDWAGLSVRDGWFWGRGLPLERYASPLITQSDVVELRGIGEVRGNFERGQVSLLYNGQNVILEGPKFKISAPSLVPDEPNREYVGVHHLNLESGRHYGTLPVKGASLEQKDRRVTYTDFQGSLDFSGKRIAVHDAVVQSEGVHFRGEGSLDLSPDSGEGFDIDIRTQEVFGSFTNVGRLLRHYVDVSWDDLPLQANIRSSQLGELSLQVRPEGVEIGAKVQGHLEQGTLLRKLPGVDLTGIKADFAYDHSIRSLEIRNIYGNVGVGNSLVRDEYTLRGPHLKVYSFPSVQAEFDLRLEGRTRDIVRFVGNTARAPDYGPGATHLVFHKDLTHIGTIQPNISKLILKDWSELLVLSAEPTANLGNLLGDVHRLAPTGCLLFGQETLSQLLDYDLSGELFGSVQYLPGNPHIDFSINGDKVSVQGRELASCQIKGKKYPSRWVIDQFWLDELSLSMDMTTKENGYQVDFFGGRYGDTILVGMEGEYLSAKRSFSGALNLLELDLAKSTQLPLFPKNIAWTQAKGQVRASGQFTAQVLDESPFVHFESSMLASVENLQVCDLPFQTVQEIQCQVDSDRGVSFHQVGLAVDEKALGVDPMGLWIDEVEHAFLSGVVQLKDLHFRVPASNLDMLAGRIAQIFPARFGPTLQGALGTLRSEGSIQGILNAELGNPYQAFRLELEENDYQLFGRRHHVRDFFIEQDPHQLTLGGHYLWREHFYSAELRTQAGQWRSGVLRLVSVLDDGLKDREEKGLEIGWDWDPDLGLGVKKIEGEVGGMQASLNASAVAAQSRDIRLGGQIRVDGTKARRLVSESLAKLCEQWKVGEGLEFNGQVSLSRDDWSQLGLEGVLGGKDFSVGGYRFKTIFAHLSYDSKRLQINNLRLSDIAGEAQTEELVCERNELGQWELRIPRLEVLDFRPSLLRAQNGGGSHPKALLLRHIELKNLSGILGQPTTYKGEGSLSFVNPSRANIQNTLWVIPSDIVARIGLDPDVLTPVVGTIHYQLGAGKVWLNRFQDVYSEGRISQFLLADSLEGSYMDFDGNLNVKLRMKQYNLIFKLAELLTISVRGTLGQPSYSLQRQSDTYQVQSPPLLTPELGVGGV